ncbi:MAG: hypothetical protein E7434_02565 [Ruminococcaceae bacterium]|nr:hypothetical protein [Oscillospiraceae bacterium]
MKKMIVLFLALCLTASMCACVDGSDPTGQVASGEKHTVQDTTQTEAVELVPEGDKIPVDEAESWGKPTEASDKDAASDGRNYFSKETLPTLPPLTSEEIPQPEPVEPDEEVQDDSTQNMNNA